MEVPGLKPGKIFEIFAHVIYSSVTVLLEYLDSFFTCLVLLYISLANTLSAFKPRRSDSDFHDFQVILSNGLPCRHDNKSLLQFSKFRVLSSICMKIGL